MGGILNHGSSGGGAEPVLGANVFYVNGAPYANTAAKFWSCLFDEVTAAAKPDTAIEMSAPTGGELFAGLLSPASLLQRDLDQFEREEVREAYADGLAALELIGPPCGVQLRLITSGNQRPFLDITLDYLDAEILPFLLAWLLEWANIPEAAWNEATIRGSFAADDPHRRLRYLVAFELRNRHISEGLYQRDVRIRFQRQSKGQKPVPRTRNTAKT